MRTAAVAMLAAGILAFSSAQASSLRLETPYLIVSDEAGKLTDERLRALANEAQDTLNRVLAFWSADPGIGRFGKIHVVFDDPLRDVYGSLFYWRREDGERRRVVGVFGSEGPPEMMAHKLTSAVFPNEDKLIRNVMGINTEMQIGNPMSFPMCGLTSDDWVLAFLAAKSYIPLKDVGPDHASWGMSDAGGGRLVVVDKPKQHRAYAEAGSFGHYLIQTYGVSRIMQFHRLSREKKRPWEEAFGVSLRQLEANWLSALRANEKAREENVLIATRLIRSDPKTACAEAQGVARRTR